MAILFWRGGGGGEAPAAYEIDLRSSRFFPEKKEEEDRMGFPPLGWEAGLVRDNGGGFSILERCMGEKEEKKVINEPSYCMLPSCGLPQKARENFLFFKKKLVQNLEYRSES